MKEILAFLPIAIVYLALKSTISPNIPLPDITLLIIFHAAHKKGATVGVLFAFALGYIEDAFTGAVLGSTSFSLIVVYLAVHLTSKRVQFTTTPMRTIGAFASSLVKGLIIFMVLRTAGLRVGYPLDAFFVAITTAITAPWILHAFGKLTAYINPHKFKDETF